MMKYYSYNINNILIDTDIKDKTEISFIYNYIDKFTFVRLIIFFVNINSVMIFDPFTNGSNWIIYIIPILYKMLKMKLRMLKI